jgi:hypothetical protein
MSFSFSEDEWVDIVKLKLNFIDYDDNITISDDIVKQHLNTAKTLIDSVFDTLQITTELQFSLYKECVTEFAKYLVMVSWAANALDIEKTPSTWRVILENELNILKSLLLRLIGDELAVAQLLGDDDKFDSLAFTTITNSSNMLAKYYTTQYPPVF